MFLSLLGLVSLLTSDPKIASPRVLPAVQNSHDDVVDPALTTLGKLVGGKWESLTPIHAEFIYEWRVKGKAIRGTGKIAIGTPNESAAESLYGWDAQKKKVYYHDYHGASTVYAGYCEMKDGKFVGDFSGLIGDTGHYKFTSEMPDENTLVSTLLIPKDGAWVPLHSSTFHRKR